MFFHLSTTFCTSVRVESGDAWGRRNVKVVDVFLVGVVASEPVIEAVNPVNVFVFVVPVREGVLYPLASDCERE